MSDMPGRGTPLQCFREHPDVWKRFSRAASGNRTDRSAVLRAFIRWYLREPGAELPERPAEQTP